MNKIKNINEMEIKTFNKIICGKEEKKFFFKGIDLSNVESDSNSKIDFDFHSVFVEDENGLEDGWKQLSYGKHDLSEYKRIIFKPYSGESYLVDFEKSTISKANSPYQLIRKKADLISEITKDNYAKHKNNIYQIDFYELFSQYMTNLCSDQKKLILIHTNKILEKDCPMPIWGVYTEKEFGIFENETSYEDWQEISFIEITSIDDFEQHPLNFCQAQEEEITKIYNYFGGQQ